MKRPNILFIMSDDHASNAISSYGSRFADIAPTPNIDRIGNEGVRLENCYCTNSICTPSRATIITGQYSHTNGVKTLCDFLTTDTPTLPELLQESGYSTALFGKWHVGAHPKGFDQWAVLPGQGFYNDPSFIFPDEESAPEGTIVDEITDDLFSYPNERKEHGGFGVMTRLPGYVTELTTDMSLDWLNDSRDPDKPFFLCCHHKAPHDFFEYHHKYENLFDGIELPEPETLFEDDDTLNEISRKYGSTVSDRCPEVSMLKRLQQENYPNGGPVDFEGLDFKARTRKAYQKYMKDYLRTVRSIDDNVGRLLDWLDESGEAENTIVIYTSDQGMMLGEHDKIDKRWIFNESQQMPFLMRYPAEIKAGQVCHDMVDNVDFAPTLLNYAGLEAPEFMQGRNACSVLEGNAPADWRQSVYYRYWMHMAHHWIPAHYGLRTPDHMLVFFYGMVLDASGCFHPDCQKNTDPGFELYDLKKDPFETTNVYDDPAYLDIREELKQQLQQMKQDVGDTDERYPELASLWEKMS
ncbi:sulfatase family protein [Tichowtungia aerotolerans]|nr:sulfatase [Tichowtungia aerotolerans]